MAAARFVVISDDDVNAFSEQQENDNTIKKSTTFDEAQKILFRCVFSFIYFLNWFNTGTQGSTLTVTGYENFLCQAVDRQHFMRALDFVSRHFLTRQLRQIRNKVC